MSFKPITNMLKGSLPKSWQSPPVYKQAEDSLLLPHNTKLSSDQRYAILLPWQNTQKNKELQQTEVPNLNSAAMVLPPF